MIKLDPAKQSAGYHSGLKILNGGRENLTVTDRLKSLDTLRGLDILVMIFVNDLSGVQGVPAWMKHIEPHLADGMTFVDVVYPAFLFIVGMSIPWALGRRLEKGEPLRQIWKHILVR